MHIFKLIFRKRHQSRTTILFLAGICLNFLVSLTALAQNSIELQQHVSAANAYMAEKDWSYASFEWRKVLEIDPKNPDAHLGLADALNKAGFMQEAIRHLEEWAKSIQDPRMLLALAKGYESTGRETLAGDIYWKLLKTNSDNASAFEGLIRVKPRYTKIEQAALEAFLKQIAESSLKQAKSLLASGEYAKSVNHYAIASVYFHDLRVVNNYGIALLLSGKAQEALHQFRRIKRQHEYWQVEANYGLTLLSLEKYYSARKAVENAISLSRNDKDKARLYNLLGYLYEISGKMTQAECAYSRAIELAPDFIKARKNIAYVYQRTDRYKEAVEAYRFLAEKRRNAENLNLLGFTYELWGRAKPAVKAYEQAIRLEPDYEDSYYNLGTLYKKMGKQDKASFYYNKLLNMGFDALETSGEPSQSSTTAVSQKKSDLFDYIDVFLSKDQT